MSQSDSLKVAVQITKYEDGLGLWIDFKEILARYHFGNPVFRSFDVNPRAKNDEWGVVSIVVDDDTEPHYKLPNGFKNGIEVGEKRTPKRKRTLASSSVQRPVGRRCIPALQEDK